MIDVNLDSLLVFLKDLQYDAQIQKETNQIYIPLKIEKIDFPLFIRVYDETHLLQLLVFMPTNIKASTKSDLARLLHFLNKEMDIPGFGMDEDSNVSFYRAMLPSHDKQIDEELVKTYLNSLQIIGNMFFPIISQVANGSTKFEEVLKKAKETMK